MHGSDNEFKTVTKKDILGKWGVFFFYPADFAFVCPTELEDLANKYEEFNFELIPLPYEYDALEPYILMQRPCGFIMTSI